MKPSFNGEKVIIVIHEATTGPGHDLRDFLLQQRVSELLFISHPLFYVVGSRRNASRYEYYRNGKLIDKKNALHWRLPEFLLYIKDFIYSIFWSVKIIGKSDMFVGVGNLNAFAGYFLKVFGRVDVFIYYVIDYVPKRFKNHTINHFYHSIEKLCAFKSSWTWNLSPRMIEARNKRWKRIFPHQLVVMHGVHINRISRVPLSSVNRHEIIYMGGLLKKQGVQVVIQALPHIIKKIPDIQFTVIGDGEYRPVLERLVETLRLKKYVKFLGYIPDHKEVENRIAQAAIAVAMYELKKDNFTYYTDPGKVKNYLGAGVPVLITDVPYVAKQVEQNKCGIIVSYDKKILAKRVIEFFADAKRIKTYRINALRFAKKYDWDIIFTRAFDSMVKT